MLAYMGHPESSYFVHHNELDFTGVPVFGASGARSGYAAATIR